MKPECIDDFGNEMHRCHYTRKLVGGDDIVFSGALVPGVKAQYITARGDGESWMS